LREPNLLFCCLLHGRTGQYNETRNGFEVLFSVALVMNAGSHILEKITRR